MSIFIIVPYYFAWHYSRAIRNVIDIWSNFLWFVWNFFSIKILFLTLFAPFERIKEKYKGGLDVKDFFESLVANTLMRIIGAFARLFMILIGIISWILILIGGAIVFLVWLVLPLLAVFLLATGLAMII